MANVDVKFYKYCQRRDKAHLATLIKEPGKNKITAEDMQKMYKTAAAKAGPTAQDRYAAVDGKSLFEFLAKHGRK